VWPSDQTILIALCSSQSCEGQPEAVASTAPIKQFEFKRRHDHTARAQWTAAHSSWAMILRWGQICRQHFCKALLSELNSGSMWKLYNFLKPLVLRLDEPCVWDSILVSCLGRSYCSRATPTRPKLSPEIWSLAERAQGKEKTRRGTKRFNLHALLNVITRQRPRGAASEAGGWRASGGRANKVPKGRSSPSFFRHLQAIRLQLNWGHETTCRSAQGPNVFCWPPRANNRPLPYLRAHNTHTHTLKLATGQQESSVARQWTLVFHSPTTNSPQASGEKAPHCEPSGK